jgi:microcystin degradation protein MlrC
MAQGLAKTLVATLADTNAIRALQARGAKVGDAFDMEVGGLVDESAGAPVRVTGTIVGINDGLQPGAGQPSVNVRFGRDNVLVISPYLVQIMEPDWLRAFALDPNDFDIFAIKSRVHFRRGFDDSGFAKTILLVEPPEPFLGTVRLEGLKYQNVDLKKFYPYGDPVFP